MSKKRNWHGKNVPAQKKTVRYIVTEENPEPEPTVGQELRRSFSVALAITIVLIILFFVGVFADAVYTIDHWTLGDIDSVEIGIQIKAFTVEVYNAAALAISSFGNASVDTSQTEILNTVINVLEATPTPTPIP